jgi:hypothetical protein
VGRAVTLLTPQHDAVLVGQPLHRLAERETVDLHQEGDDVTTGLAAEAVEKSSTRGDMEGRRLLVVEGAQPLERATARLAQRDVGRHDLVDARLLTHLGDVVVPDPSSHVAESTSAHPHPHG